MKTAKIKMVKEAQTKIIEFMKLKQSFLEGYGVPGGRYFNKDDEGCINQWKDSDAERVWAFIKGNRDKLEGLTTISCPFCIKYTSGTDNLPNCLLCEYGANHGICTGSNKDSDYHRIKRSIYFQKTLPTNKWYQKAIDIVEGSVEAFSKMHGVELHTTCTQVDIPAKGSPVQIGERQAREMLRGIVLEEDDTVRGYRVGSIKAVIGWWRDKGYIKKEPSALEQARDKRKEYVRYEAIYPVTWKGVSEVLELYEQAVKELQEKVRK